MGCGASKATPPSNAPPDELPLPPLHGLPPHLETRFSSSRFMRMLWGTVKIDEAPLVFVPLSMLDTLTSIPRSNDKVTVRADTLPHDARAVFVSHRWLRPWHTDEECLENGHEWAGYPHPDDAQGTKLALICDGCRELAKAMGWEESQMYCWIDFCCVEQEDEPRRIAAIESLLGYVAACDAVLIPCSDVPSPEAKSVDVIPGGYADRAWTRLESMAFHFVSAFLPRPKGMSSLISAVARLPDGGLFHKHFAYEIRRDFSKRAGEGAMHNESDRELIKSREREMLGFVMGSLAERGAITNFAKHNMVKYLDIGPKGVRDLAEAALKPAKSKDKSWSFNTEITELDLTCNGIGNDGAKALADALAPQQGPDGTWAYNNTLRALDLTMNGIGPEGIKALADALAPRKDRKGNWTCTNAVSNLRLFGNGIGSKGAKALADALAPRQNPDGTWMYNNTLSTLGLFDNEIGDEGVKALADALAPKQNPDGTWTYNNALKSLDLYYNGIGDEGVKALAGALAPRQNPDGSWACNSALSTLNFGVNEIGADGATALADALGPRQNPDGTWTYNSGLTTLWLFDNDIGAQGAKALADSLAPRQNPDGTWAYNNTLRRLELNSNEIATEGTKALADAMAPRRNTNGIWTYNNSLSTFGLLGNEGIGDEGAMALADALVPRQNPDGTWTCNSTFSTLGLDITDVGPEALKALVGALAPRQNLDGTWTYHNALKSLELYGAGDEIDTDVVKALADALAPRQNPNGTWTYNNALTTLRLRGNNVGDEGAKALEDLRKALNTHRPGDNAITVEY